METAENCQKTAAEEPVSPLLFAVLVPHRDCLPVLEAYRRNLFAAGLDGAFSFPAAAPLALLKRPLNSAELKAAAAELRNHLGDKKIVSAEQNECNGWTFAESAVMVCFFGAVLDLPLPAFPPDAVLYTWEKPILAPALIASDDSLKPPVAASKADAELSFRAAALANLALQMVPNAEDYTKAHKTESFEKDFSFTWNLGPLHWLPRYKGNGCD